MRCGSVFSGIGLLDYGLTLAGFDHAWLCESDPWRREILAMRWPEATVYPDIRELGDDLEPIDMLAGGFPCRGISSAGKRQGFGHPETALWREQLRLVRLLRPRYVLVENVAALLTVRGGGCFAEVLAGLAESGYECWWDVLPAAAVGAPHLRERVFVVGHTDSPGRAERWQPERAESEGPRLVADEVAVADSGQRGRGAAVHHLRTGQPDAQGGPPADPSAPVGCPERNGEPEQPGQPPRERDDAGGLRGQARGGEWGDYTAAVHRWEAVIGRPAPEPLVRRVDDGSTPRIHRSRLSALGDGVQVQVGELVGRMILEHGASA